MARSYRGSFLSGVAIGHFTFDRSGHPFYSIRCPEYETVHHLKSRHSVIWPVRSCHDCFIQLTAGFLRAVYAADHHTDVILITRKCGSKGGTTLGALTVSVRLWNPAARIRPMRSHSPGGWRQLRRARLSCTVGRAPDSMSSRRRA